MITDAKKITETGNGLRVLTRSEVGQTKKQAKEYKLKGWKPKFNHYAPRPKTHT